jgi:8-amino-7-oxononanoate synthase
MSHQIDNEYELILNKRKENHLLRTFGKERDPLKSDFYSNDYLGLCNNNRLKEELSKELLTDIQLGSSGSRLVSGDHLYINNLETLCKSFFETEEAIFFPNGYMANLALLSSIANRHDLIIYDDHIHVSLKDGIRLSMARGLPFRHNSIHDLEKKLKIGNGRKFVVIEAIYSMDGDLAYLEEISGICENHNAFLIVDEAHSTGTFGKDGKGLCIHFSLQNKVWARIYTFGKALGTAGAILAISKPTRNFLINFAHPLIYSTAPTPLQSFICQKQLETLKNQKELLTTLKNRIGFWNSSVASLDNKFSKNEASPVQYFLTQGNQKSLDLVQHLDKKGIQVKAMLSPTVKMGTERIRISLHNFNQNTEIEQLITSIKEFENIF